MTNPKARRQQNDMARRFFSRPDQSRENGVAMGTARIAPSTQFPATSKGSGAKFATLVPLRGAVLDMQPTDHPGAKALGGIR